VHQLLPEELAELRRRSNHLKPTPLDNKRHRSREKRFHDKVADEMDDHQWHHQRRHPIDCQCEVLIEASPEEEQELRNYRQRQEQEERVRMNSHVMPSENETIFTSIVGPAGSDN